MAIVARYGQNDLHVRRDTGRGFERFGFYYWRICSIGAKKLQDNERSGRNDNHNFQYFFHHRKALFISRISY